MNSYNRNPIMEKIAAVVIGLIAIVAGIVIIQENSKSFNEYKKSSDKQTVVAEITDVYVRTERRRTSGRHYSTREVKRYDCTLEYTINGNLIRNKRTYSDEKRVGEKMTLNVYKDDYGHYQIAKITSEAGKKSSDNIAYFIILFGGIAILYGVLAKVD